MGAFERRIESSGIKSRHLSIVLPGRCIGNCDFCYWKRSEREASAFYYMRNLHRLLDKLPPSFDQVSITGGEPTISTMLLPALTAIEQAKRYKGQARRFRKVVLHTTGYNLDEYFDSAHFGMITHVNISRHAMKDAVNCAILGTTLAPITGKLRELNDALNRLGIESCANAVITDSIEDAEMFVWYMRDMGFTKINFRKIQARGSNLNVTPLESLVMNKYHRADHITTRYSRSHLYIIKGMRTWWTASMKRPAWNVGEPIDKLVFHSDGKLYADWNKMFEVSI